MVAAFTVLSPSIAFRICICPGVRVEADCDAIAAQSMAPINKA
jgi:hypothetical protein